MKSRINLKANGKVRTCKSCGKKFYDNPLYDNYNQFFGAHNCCTECRMIRDVEEMDLTKADKDNIITIIKFSKKAWIVDDDGCFESRLVMPVTAENGKPWYLDVVEGTFYPENALIVDAPETLGEWADMYYNGFFKDCLLDAGFDVEEVDGMTTEELSLIDTDYRKIKAVFGLIRDSDYVEVYEWKCPKCGAQYESKKKSKMMRCPNCETPLVML